MLRRSVFAVLVLVPVFAFGAIGCMGDDDSDIEAYEASVVQARNDVDDAITGIAEAQSRQQFIERMEQAAILISRAADNLDEAEVADGFEEETTTLTAALRRLSNDLEQTAAQFEVTPELFNTEGLSFEGWTQANAVLRDLGEQGIAVEPLANR